MVQNAIYLGMVEPALRRNVSPEAVVHSFNYFFPSSRTWGRTDLLDAKRTRPWANDHPAPLPGDR